MASNESGSGWISFAGIVLLIIGSLDVIQGLFAIIDGDYVVSTGEAIAFIDVSGWGWILLIWGAVVFLAGLALLGGAGWGRWFAIIGATLGAVAQMTYMANYPQATPLWNVAILALYIIVIYSLITKWEGYKQSVQ